MCDLSGSGGMQPPQGAVGSNGMMNPAMLQMLQQFYPQRGAAPTASLIRTSAPVQAWKPPRPGVQRADAGTARLNPYGMGAAFMGAPY